MSNNKIDLIYQILIESYTGLEVPSVTAISQMNNGDPFKVLVSTIISLRTKDPVTLDSSIRLFDVAPTPEAMLKADIEAIEQAIYPASFYRNKTKNIIELSERLIREFDGKVPADLDVLLTFKGVGRKTANLVMVEAFGVDAICVDSHVHRICNRLGIVDTKTPDDTEMVLRKVLPQSYWIKWNEILVAYGQKICRPISPFCGDCHLKDCCDQRDVTTKR